MRRAVPVLVILVVAGASPTQADDASSPGLRLSTSQLLRSVEVLPSPSEHEAEKFLDRVVTYLRTEALGVRGLVTLLPAEAGAFGELKPPRFAFVARAEGRTLISLTQPGSSTDEEDDVILQRWLVSDLLAGKRYSLTVYKEHTIDKDALRFLGVGARLLLRPDLRVSNWRFRFELFGSYHPDHEATAYFALTGRAFAPPPVPLTGGAALAAQDRAAIVPLRW